MVIKCAHINTNQIGVTKLMLKRIDLVVAAFEMKDGSFELWTLSPNIFTTAMRDSGSQNHEGRVGLVSRSVFHESGTHAGAVQP